SRGKRPCSSQREGLWDSWRLHLLALFRAFFAFCSRLQRWTARGWIGRHPDREEATREPTLASARQVEVARLAACEEAACHRSGPAVHGKKNVVVAVEDGQQRLGHRFGQHLPPMRPMNGQRVAHTRSLTMG